MWISSDWLPLKKKKKSSSSGFGVSIICHLFKDSNKETLVKSSKDYCEIGSWSASDL